MRKFAIEFQILMIVKAIVVVHLDVHRLKKTPIVIIIRYSRLMNAQHFHFIILIQKY